MNLIKRFDALTKEGDKFIKLWNKAYKNGIQQKIAKHFKISVASVYRVRKMLSLPDLHDHINHPGKKAFLRRIRKSYFKGNSSLRIGRSLRLNSETIRKNLKKSGVKLGPAHVTNPKYFKTRSGINSRDLLKIIRDLYCYKRMTAAAISKEIGIDQGTVCTKLKAMNIEIRHNQKKKVEGGWRCDWCGEIIESVWQKSGPRRQKFCDHRCSNQAKDYRRYIQSQRTSQKRFNSMNNFLKDVWKEEFDLARSRLINVIPVL